MLSYYEEEKRVLDRAMAEKKIDSEITAEEVLTTINRLYSLEINGSKIKESLNKQERARKAEHTINYKEVVITKEKDKHKKNSKFIPN